MSVASTPPTILLADGDAQSREVLGSFFQQHGWRYDVVAEAELVDTALDKSSYDIVIADVAMPGMDSLGLLQAILQKHPTQAVIALSRDTSYDEALNYFRSGATDLLARPVDLPWLERVVRQIVYSKRIEERERLSYKFVTHEKTEMVFSCREVIELGTVPLPIVGRLEAIGALEHAEGLRVRLAVQEAVLNGLEHGNLALESVWKEEVRANGDDRFAEVRRERLSDPRYSERSIHVSVAYEEEVLQISIRDEGEGFLNLGAGNQTHGAHPVSCSGRGLALMSSAVDEVLFDRNGSEVTLRKRTRRARRA
jgi:CheY-like chemotaxis protein